MENIRLTSINGENFIVVDQIADKPITLPRATQGMKITIKIMQYGPQLVLACPADTANEVPADTIDGEPHITLSSKFESISLVAIADHEWVIV